MKYYVTLLLWLNSMRDKSGATAIEYGLIAALIAIGGVAALGADEGLGENIQRVFFCSRHTIGGGDPARVHSCRTIMGI